MTYTYDISGDDFSSAGAASSDIKKKLRQLGLPNSLIKRTAIAMYEAEINMVIHAGGGVTEVTVEADRIAMEFRDEGPGIPDIALAMTEGWSTASEEARQLGFGAGMGLPNIDRNVDGLDIYSTPGAGTTVRMTLDIGGDGK
jgi:anti-sigma regulatory factor (Ser/Thr protein kinase)